MSTTRPRPRKAGDTGPWHIRFHDLREYNDEVYLIGPYPNRQARDADLERLYDLTDPAEDTDFERSDTPLDDADRVVTPDRVAGCTTAEAFLAAFFSEAG